MDTNYSPVGTQIKYEHRRGLIPAKIAAQFGIRGADRVTRFFNVSDRSECPSGVTLHVRCLSCGVTAESPEALAASHPSHKEMVREESTHVWTWAARDERAATLVEERIARLKSGQEKCMARYDKHGDLRALEEARAHDVQLVAASQDLANAREAWMLFSDERFER